MIKTNNILLLSNDDTLINGIKTSIPESNIYTNFSNLPIDIDLVIVDDYALESNTIDKLLNFNCKIINVSSKKIVNAINIERPFSLKEFLFEVKKLLFKNNNIFKFRNFDIVNGMLNIDNKEVKFGSKEILLIKYLYKANGFDKTVLLNEIWGYNSDIETKVLENTVNNIRKKLKNLNIDNFIIVNDGLYKISDVFY